MAAMPQRVLYDQLALLLGCEQSARDVDPDCLLVDFTARLADIWRLEQPSRRLEIMDIAHTLLARLGNTPRADTGWPH